MDQQTRAKLYKIISEQTNDVVQKTTKTTIKILVDQIERYGFDKVKADLKSAGYLN